MKRFSQWWNTGKMSAKFTTVIAEKSKLINNEMKDWVYKYI